MAHVSPYNTLLLVLVCIAGAWGGDADTCAAKGERKQLMVPPMENGGVAGLWTNDHLFVVHKYGPYELLNFKNTDYRIKRDSITDKTWQLVAMGNFLPTGLQFATLARATTRPEGTVLIMFEWKEAADSAEVHGVFYHSFLKAPKVLIRTKQGKGGVNDTLELSSAATQKPWGKCYYDTGKKRVSLEVVGR